MSVTQEKQPHRTKRCPRPLISALVARPVTRNEIKNNEKAQKAMAKEWYKLVEKGVFDLSVVRSAYDVKKDAENLGFKAHFGRVLGI